MSDLGPVVVRRTVNAPQETVWGMLSDATARTAWWPETEIELEVGGAVIDARGQHGTVDVLVEGLTLGFRWADDGAENERTVVVMLRPEDEDFDHTRVTVIESGFATLADAANRVQAETLHWEQTLDALTLNAEDSEALAAAVAAGADLADESGSDAAESTEISGVAEASAAESETDVDTDEALAESASELDDDNVEEAVNDEDDSADDSEDEDIDEGEADGEIDDVEVDVEAEAVAEAVAEAEAEAEAEEPEPAPVTDEANESDESDDDTVEVQLDEGALHETMVLDQIDEDAQETTVIELDDEAMNPTIVIDELDENDFGGGDDSEAEQAESDEVEQSFETVLTGDQSIIEIVQDDVVEGETFDPADAILLPEVGAPFTETGGIQITADLGVEEPVDVDETSEWERLLRGE